MNIAPSQPVVLWKQVLGLTAIQGAIALMWLIYGLYLPQLLGQFGLSPQTAGVLLIVETGLAALLEPIMGGLSDRSQRWVGTRFPFISIGVILASALFIAIPALAIFGTPGAVMRGVVLFVLVAWAMAMTVFRSPAIALLQRYSSVPHLPLATSLLTLTSGLIGTAQPTVNKFILSFGAAATFAIGSIVLLGATAALRSIDPPGTPALSDASPPASTLPYTTLALIGGVGLSVSCGTRLVMGSLGKFFAAQFPNTDPGSLMFAVAIALAVLAVPAGFVAVRVGNQRALQASLILAIASSGLLLLGRSIGLILVVVALVPCLSLVTNSVIPFALEKVPPEKAGLGIGMYFGGAAAASCLFGLLLPHPEQLSPVIQILLAAIAFFIAAVCVTIRFKARTTAPRQA